MDGFIVRVVSATALWSLLFKNTFLIRLLLVHLLPTGNSWLIQCGGAPLRNNDYSDLFSAVTAVAMEIIHWEWLTGWNQSLSLFWSLPLSCATTVVFLVSSFNVMRNSTLRKPGLQYNKWHHLFLLVNTPGLSFRTAAHGRIKSSEIVVCCTCSQCNGKESWKILTFSAQIEQ